MTSPHELAEQKLNQLKKIVAMLPQNEWQQEIHNLEQAMFQRQHWVAVFGAFSAGKSSLINALVGDNTLPVSPNPTTASVTQLLGPEFSRVPSGQALVTAKTAEQMWHDVSQAFNTLHITIESLEEAFSKPLSLSLSKLPPSARKAASFVTAAAAGYPSMESKLGQQWTVSGDELATYTADEKFACYVNQVELTHDSPLLRQGIVLVDTPGVDSIHRRHTDVAFQYMQKADAILFVLYYTHAFSRADKDFLLQLAGVQDVVGTNKLFVVINAVDLATTEAERLDVQQRVVTELRQVGIRESRIYEVSSQVGAAAIRLARIPEDAETQRLVRQRLRLAVDAPLPSVENLLKWSGVSILQSDLQAYIETQSDTLFVGAIERLWERVFAGLELTVSRLKNRLVATAADDSSWRNACDVKRRHFLDVQQDMNEGQSAYEAAMTADWDELVFHVGERIRMKLPALMREAYHPGRFRSGSDIRQGLEEGASDFVAMLNRQIELECRTLGLRMRSQSLDAWKRMEKGFSKNLLDLELALNSQLAMLPEITDLSWIEAQLSPTLMSSAHRHFSSAKQFFEGPGQKMLIEVGEQFALAEALQCVLGIEQHLRKEMIQDWKSYALNGLQMAVNAIDDALEERSLEELRVTVEHYQEVLLQFVSNS